jgi:ABC-2 type transport system permease protein
MLIARRELNSYLVSASGWLIIGIVLLVQGLLFNAFGMRGEQKSFDVMYWFFYFSSGTTMIASIFIAMRLFAEEKQLGTMVLLETSPVTEWSVVLGKFLGGWLFLCLLLLLSIYMPLLILVNGKITVAHLFAGYLGLALLGAACIAIGTLASSLAGNQVVAAVIAGASITALVLAWMLARKIDGPLGDFIGYLDFFDKHFRDFARGTVKLGSVIYYAGIAYFALLATTAVIGARRWRG